MKPARRVILFVGVLLLVMAAGGPATYAQGGYPEPVDPYVNDFARLLTPEHASAIRSLFSDLKRDTGIEAVVVTIGSIHDYPTGDATIESFATNLFNTWGVGDKAKNNGVMILVAVNDRKVRIEVGAGYESTLNAAMQEVIDEHMLPAFRRDDYSRGIYDGARAVIHELTGQWPADTVAAAIPSPTRAAASSSPRSATGPATSVDPTVVIGGLAVGVGAAAFGLRRYARYHRRRCPNCRMYMIRLDEVSDDVYLDSGQKLEETLASVDYDVWKCPSCNMHALHGYNGWFASFKPCPRCNYRTLGITRETLEAPTYSSTGKDVIKRDCRHCQYHDEQIVVVPMLVESSSGSGMDSGSSGGDFGGGTSSGDGASGSW